MELQFTLNSRPTVCETEPNETLYQVLRKKGISSVKCGCETTSCGLCTVILNEKAVLSCSVPAARCAGKNVVTLEGIGREAETLGDYLAAEGAEQCGFCTPGLIVNAVCMARENPDIDDEGMAVYLAGNLCRCTGYEGQRRAIRKWLDARKRGEC